MGFIMILGDLAYQFKNENALRYGTNVNNQGGKRKNDYSDADVVSFKHDVAGGVRISDAAKEHGIPISTARTLVPKVKAPKNRALAMTLLKQKLSGELDSSYREIGRKSGYTCSGILRMKRESL
jgi:hypothetical protein